MDIDKIVPDVKGLFEASISGSGPMHADSISCSYWFRSDDLRPFNWNIGRVLGSGRWDQGRFLGKTRGSGWKVRSIFSDDEGWKIDGDFQELVIRQGMSNSLCVVGEMLFKSGTPTKNLGSVLSRSIDLITQMVCGLCRQTALFESAITTRMVNGI